MPASTGTNVSMPDNVDATPAVLDWDAFLAATFPKRRRHDLEAVVAYGLYRRSSATGEGPADGPRAPCVDPTAIRRWEDEGGA